MKSRIVDVHLIKCFAVENPGARTASHNLAGPRMATLCFRSGYGVRFARRSISVCVINLPRNVAVTMAAPRHRYPLRSRGAQRGIAASVSVPTEAGIPNAGVAVPRKATVPSKHAIRLPGDGEGSTRPDAIIAGFCDDLTARFEAARDRERAASQAKYLRNLVGASPLCSSHVVVEVA